MMLKKVRDYVEKYHMLQKGDALVVGVSGGADSVCLLFALADLRKDYDIDLWVVHVNHGIREEAGQDADYVEALCDRLDIPFFLFEENVESLAKENGLSTEEAGRKLRYECFGKVLREQAGDKCSVGKAKIAVAHNQNDRAETMLFHLFRGSGLTGLGSIRPVRDNVIRPLLCLSRREIEAYLDAEGIAYQVDATNKEDLYARNKIRNRVLPYVEENISAGAVEHIAMAAQRVSESQEYIRQTVETLFEKYVVQEEKGEFSVFAPDMIALHPFLRSELILSLFEALVPYRKDIGAVHVGQVEDLMLQSGNRQVDLPYGIEAKRRYDVITLSLQKTIKGEASKAAEGYGSIQVEVTEGLVRDVELPEGQVLKFSLLPCQKGMEIPQNQYTKWFDYDKIKNYITVRNRLAGDYLTINEALQKKSLQDYMVDAKIPKELRGGVWLLADEQHILWVVGYRISQEYKVTENTKRILQVQLLGGNEHGTY